MLARKADLVPFSWCFYLNRMAARCFLQGDKKPDRFAVTFDNHPVILPLLCQANIARDIGFKVMNGGVNEIFAIIRHKAPPPFKVI